MEETQGTTTTYVASLTKPFIAIIIGVILILACFGLVPLFLSGSSKDSSLMMNLVYIVPVLAILGFCVVLLFLKNKITVSDEGVLIVTGGYFRKYISFEELDTVELGPYTTVSQGIGVRVIPGRRLGYLCGGKSILLSTRDGASIVASTPDPEKVIEDIQLRRGIKPKPQEADQDFM